MKKAMEPKSYIRVARADGAAGDPWSQRELIEPAALASQMPSDA